MLHSKTPAVKKRAPVTTRSVSLRRASAADHHTGEQYSKTGRKKTKASLKKQSIMEYSPGFPQYTKSLRSCTVNRAKMLLKSYLWIKCQMNTRNPFPDNVQTMSRPCPDQIMSRPCLQPLSRPDHVQTISTTLVQTRPCPGHVYNPCPDQTMSRPCLQPFPHSEHLSVL